LKSLDLSHTRVTDSGIAEIARLDGLRELWLVGCAVDDRCMADIGRMKSLIRVDISGTKVSADGLRQLAHSKSLQFVYCAGCKGDVVGAYDEVKKRLPGCAVLPTIHRG
jgi:hypothetical protein